MHAARMVDERMARRVGNRRSRKDDEDEVSQTRICIKNLPVQFTESNLKDYLHQQVLDLEITDCRILRNRDGITSRRIAFVGLAKPEHAASCLRLLHKAYCRTAKLVVEYAHLPNKKEDVENNEQMKVEEESKETAIDKKKQEFLAVMGVSGTGAKSSSTSKRKFWANDDDQQPASVAAEKKPTEELSVENEEMSSSSDSSSNSDDSEDDDDADPSVQSIGASQSAMDFLRSKQVAVEDLDDEASSSSSSSSDSASSSDNDELVPMKGVKEVKSSHVESKGETKVHLQDDNSEDVNDDDQETAIAENRLFLRNLPFSATEDDIRAHLQSYGAIVECHVAIDDRKRSKGFGFVSFERASDAKAALAGADGHDFQGRLLHILPARKPPSNDDDIGKNLSYKDKMELKRKQDAAKDTKGWSASFVRGDAVVDNLATRLGLRKGDILSVKDGLSSGDAAVRLALGETAIIEENRKYFVEHGIDMEALVSVGKSGSSKGNEAEVARSKTMILVKNLPYDTTKDELLKTFASGAEALSKILLPPSRTIAVVEYGHQNDAKRAFRRLAYRRFKSVPLYLEWAPLASRLESVPVVAGTADDAKAENDEVEENEEDFVAGPTPTIYVKNLNFSTTEEQLRQAFAKHANDVRTVRIPKKVAPVKRTRGGGEQQGQTLSMGFGFVEFGSKESARKVLKKLQGTMLDGHVLELKPSNGKQDSNNVATPASKSEKTPSKLIVRNVPFQATRKELLQLFGSFGQLKKVRLPKKFDGRHRGFAFIEYLTGKEAAAAMKVLSRTHLYGRHLVIEWAAADDDGLTILRERAERDLLPQGKKIRFNS